ncbi:MAG: endolytic transglycosylase MltG [Clostridia bacterium]|nr:endolytic transglycosylase MltG [Clostridia bacterium]
MDNKELNLQPENNAQYGDFITEEKQTEVAENKPQKRKKKKGVRITVLVISLLLVLAVALGAIYAAFDYYGGGPGRSGEYTVTIAGGSSTAQIAASLQKSGTIKLPLLFRIYSKYKGYDKYYKSGEHVFTDQMGYSAIAKELMRNIETVPQVKVTIPEGKGIDDIAKILEEKGVCTKEDFLYEVKEGVFDYDFIKDIPADKVYYRLEGYLFPDTYNFYYYDSKECAHLAVDRMLGEFNERIAVPYKEQIEKSGYSLHEIVTLASVIELEAGGKPDEMANVSAVFHNRLSGKGPSSLGSSPTRKYPFGEFSDYSDKYYNTYKIIGLPVGPYCSPGESAVDAALNPTDNFDYSYFCTDAKMNFYYHRSNAEQLKTVNKLKAEKNWVYED